MSDNDQSEEFADGNMEEGGFGGAEGGGEDEMNEMMFDGEEGAANCGEGGEDELEE